MRTIAHVYDSYAEASRVVSQLEAAGVSSDNISLISGEKGAGGTGTTTDGDVEQGAATGAGTGATLGTVLGGGAGLLAGLGSLAIPGVGPIVAAGWLVATLTGAGLGAAAGGLAGSLIGAGVSEADAQSYSEGVSRGGTLVTVRADEGMASRIQQIMGLGGTASTGPSVTDTATTHVTSPGMTTAGIGATATTTGASAATTGTTGTDDTIKVVREDLVVGKRDVERGGVRVTSHVVETPVEERVHLHDERVTIERRPVDQAVGSLPADAFQERVIEATAMSEEAVVAKDVRVVEEIAIRKEATERVETVRDTVRETKVDIEDTTATSTTTTGTTGTAGMGTGTPSTTDTAATTGRNNTGTTRDTTGGTSVSGALPRE